MRIAITGATGLIGHAAATLLEAQGHSLVRLGRGAASDVSIDLAKADGVPADALAGCDALVHAAGVTDEDFGDRGKAWAKVVLGAEGLLAAARGASVGKLLYVSSAHVYGPLEGTIDETRVVNPLSHYAIAHYATEQLFRRAALDTGAALLIARPCAVFGMPVSIDRFARWSLIPFDFPRQALGGRIVLKTPGLQRRNFVAADGVAKLAGWWLEQPRPQASLANAPGPHEMPVYDFGLLCARIAEEETGRRCEVVRPEPSGVAPPPLQYTTRVGGHLPGTSLEDHLRAMIRALSQVSST